jgi:hypothetical protein
MQTSLLRPCRPSSTSLRLRASFTNSVCFCAAQASFLPICRRRLSAWSKAGFFHLILSTGGPPHKSALPRIPAQQYLIARVRFSSVSRSVQAVWLMQGWLFFNDAAYWRPPQMKALLHAVPKERMIVLDLFADVHPVWSQSDSFYGVPFIW